MSTCCNKNLLSNAFKFTVQGGVRLNVALALGGWSAEHPVLSKAPAVVAFEVTDGAHDLKVSYSGLLPELFREGQGVVAEGVLAAPGQLRADAILAKHDERYMPREVVDALKKQGRWQEGTTAATQ